MLLLILLFSTSSAQFSGEDPTPASSLGPRDFNHHAYLANYLDRDVEPTKQGPVLFPNDAPPPPRPPLIVTSRPIIESIARSELNPTPATINNSIAEASHVKPEFRLRSQFLRERRPDYPTPESRPFFRLKPALLAKVQGYKPFLVSTPEYGLYAKNGGDDGRYGDYDEPPPTLPPIYKAIADHAKQKVLKLKYKPSQAHHEYQEKEAGNPRPYQHNDVRDDIDYDHDSNYAFSYTVKDHKTGDDYSHSQHSSGSATNGEYRVRLPDGRMQIVSYTADKNGYKADVRYDEEDKTAGNSIDYNHDYGKHDYAGNTHDYPPNRHDYAGNTHDYPPNKNNYAGNTHDYPPNRHGYALNSNDYPANVHGYAANRLPYPPVRQDYAANDRDYDRTNYNYIPNKNYVTNPPPVKENFNEYSDVSKEYYNTDYSLEYDGKDDNYAPHRSKFSSFVPKHGKLGTIVVPSAETRNVISSKTVKPSYEELKPLFVNKNLYSVQPTENYLKNIELSVPSTTSNPSNYDGTTEHVVLIGGGIRTTKPSFYTNIRNLPLTATPSPVIVTTPSTFVTPGGYLLSTISSLKDGQVPVLSGRFIDKINKYLTFT